MFPCEEYVCNDCGCEFYFPMGKLSTSATKDTTVTCPKCGSTNCS